MYCRWSEGKGRWRWMVAAPDDMLMAEGTAGTRQEADQAALAVAPDAVRENGATLVYRLPSSVLTRRQTLAALGLFIQATGEDIQAAYHRLAMQHHPDRGGDAEQFKKIVEAYKKASARTPETEHILF
jgi:hypothetical protein